MSRKLGVRPHVTAGAGGFVDITARAKRIVFSGYFTAGAEPRHRGRARCVIAKEGKVRKLVDAVEHVSFSGRRAVAQGQDITYVTERCVMKLTPEGVVVTEIAPGVDLERDVLGAGGVPAAASRRTCRTDGRGAVPARSRSGSTSARRQRWRCRHDAIAVRLDDRRRASPPSRWRRPEKLNALERR